MPRIRRVGSREARGPDLCRRSARSEAPRDRGGLGRMLEALRARWHSALAGGGSVLALDPGLTIDDELRQLGARVLRLEELVRDEARGGGDALAVADAVVARVLAAAPAVLRVVDLA